MTPEILAQAKRVHNDASDIPGFNSLSVEDQEQVRRAYDDDKVSDISVTPVAAAGVPESDVRPEGQGAQASGVGSPTVLLVRTNQSTIQSNDRAKEKATDNDDASHLSGFNSLSAEDEERERRAYVDDKVSDMSITPVAAAGVPESDVRPEGQGAQASGVGSPPVLLVRTNQSTI